ncbi:TadE-like protein [Stakelama pacifica]|uniref:TadE-like protein n=1 Tax=Stakelama pacifica TaxID=517720 RepID=A0A4R6FXE7_9SPHN|nr:TadE-like protein [Stakelama pacifica]
MKRLFRSMRAATAVEFALLAPLFFLMLFGIIEMSRVLWAQETIEEVAFATARCMSVSDQCASEAQQRQFALARASHSGIGLTGADVVLLPNADCNGVPANAVRLTTSFASPVRGLVPGIPQKLQAEACFPVLS